MTTGPVRTGITLPGSLAAPQPGWTIEADVIVVGSGIAGLATALAARDLGSVLLVTKTDLEAGATAWAQGGIAAALDPEDSPAQHLSDTLAAGGGLCDPEAVRVLVTEGPRRVRELARLGADFARTPSGDLALAREGGHLRHRIAHAGGDATGREISRALVDRLTTVASDPRITVVEHALVLDVLTDAAGRACGVTLHVIGEGSRDGVGAALGRVVVLARVGSGRCMPRRRTHRWRPGTVLRPPCARARPWPTWSSCSSTRRSCGSGPRPRASSR